MGKRALVAVLLSWVLGAIPLAAADPKQKPNSQSGSQQNTDPQTFHASQLGPGKYVGTVVSAPDAEGEGILTLKIEYSKMQVNQQAMASANATVQRQYQQVLRLQQTMRTRRPSPANVQQLQRAMAQLQLARARAGQAVTATHTSANVEFPLDKDVKVRIKVLPEQFDDKGNIKRYTPEELHELKGNDSSLPGYKSSLDQVKTGETVQVTVVALPRQKPSQTAKKKDAGEAHAAAAHEQPVKVKTLLIVNDNTKKQANKPARPSR